MRRFAANAEPSAWGRFVDAEALRRWSFERRTPEHRLTWLQSAVELAYQSGALTPRRPDTEPTQAPAPFQHERDDPS